MDLQIMKEGGQRERKIRTSCKGEGEIKQRKGKESKTKQSKQSKQHDCYSTVEV